jgi:hypothetical protein
MNYIQLNNHSRFDDEEWEVANKLGFQNVTPFYKKHLMQRKLKIKKGDWYQVTYDSGSGSYTGWVSGNYLDVDDD